MQQEIMLHEQEREIELSLAPLNLNGAENTSFTSKKIETSSLYEVFTSANYSPIIWRNGIRKADNFMSAAGFCVDIDEGMSIEKADETLDKANLNYALITTKSHTPEKERFRILIPFSHKLFTLTRYQQAAHKIDDLLGRKCDPAVFDGARFLFGSPDEAYYICNWNGEDFDVKDISTYNLAEIDLYAGDWDDSLTVVDENGKSISVTEIKGKSRIHCPFHDDNTSSAFIEFSPRSNNWFIFCSACKETFWKSKAPLPDRLYRFWSHGTSIYETGITNESFYFQEIGEKKFHTLIGAAGKSEKEDTYNWLVNNHHISKLNRIDYIGCPNIEKPEYEIAAADGVIQVKYSPIPVGLQDNCFIEDYLDRAFGEYKRFIKEYMAVYTYTNYEKLPTIILTGDRGVGKNVIAELIADIYEPLSVFWKPEEGNFNPELQKKLLIADETVTKDIKNYTYLKRLSGQSFHLVNEKYTPKYQVRNNINIIILSNRHLPIFAEREELPTRSENNQFFVFEVKPFTGDPDKEFGNKLKARLGHYVRTELKTVFERLDRSKYRYNIEVPITPEEIRLFNSSISVDEAAADKLMRYVARQKSDVADWKYRLFVEDSYLPLDKIFDSMGFDHVEKSKVLRNLRERGMVTSDESRKIKRGNLREYCYAMTAKMNAWLESACTLYEQASEQALKAA